jgi:hypothetical protein
VTKMPIVDEADVARMIDFIFGKSLNQAISPEERADAAYQVALGVSLLRGTAKPYAQT